MVVDEAREDRIRGVMLGAAVGDALGAGYEFGSAPLGPEGPEMIGGGLGGFAPGEWTDDTTMSWCVLDAGLQHRDLTSGAALDAVARSFHDWFRTSPPDIGIQTRRVLAAVGPEPSGAELTAAARELADTGARTAGNGSLMRTAPVALAHLGDPPGHLASAARAVSALTHADPLAGEACVLWSAAIRHAVVTGGCDVRAGLGELVGGRRALWEGFLEQAETDDPGAFRPNGFVVTALQAAWSAICQTPVPPEHPERHLADALAAAVAIGDDTDTVASIAGALLGARWGASAVPPEWVSVCHGYPRATSAEQLAEAGLRLTAEP